MSGGGFSLRPHIFLFWKGIEQMSPSSSTRLGTVRAVVRAAVDLRKDPRPASVLGKVRAVVRPPGLPR
jgi:hypothetical protein